MGNFGSQVYDASAEAGNVFTTIGLVVGVIIGIALVIGGMVLFFKKNTRSASAVASVSNLVCNTPQQMDKMLGCSFDVTFTPQGRSSPITVTVQTDTTDHYVGITNIKAWYDPNNPTDVSLSRFSYRTTGIILIVIALFIVGVSYLSYWAARKSKFIASTMGASGALNIITGGRL